jgi:hypothetical protein
LRIGTRSANLFDPPQYRLLLETVSAGEIEHDAIRLTLSPDKAKAQHREQHDKEGASHGGSSGWHTLLVAGMKNKCKQDAIVSKEILPAVMEGGARSADQ